MLLSLFTGSVLEPVFPDAMPKTLAYACLLLRLLYDVALDSFDKPNLAGLGMRSPSHKQNSVEVTCDLYFIIQRERDELVKHKLISAPEVFRLPWKWKAKYY